MKKYTIPAVVAVAVAAGVAGIALTNEKPVVSVNGVGISKEVVDNHMSTIPAQLVQSQEEAIRKNIVERLVEQELVIQDAEKSKLTEETEYKDALAQLTRNFTYNYVIQKHVQADVSDEKLMEIYEAQKQNFVMPRAKARHILVKTEAEAKDLIKALDAGSDFATLATEKSIGPSAGNGGDLGEFSMSDMVPAFAQAAFSLEAGKYSETPVQTQFGWHVILLEEKNMTAILPFEAVKQQLAKQIAEKSVTDYVKGLREAAEIKYYTAEEMKKEATETTAETAEQQ